MQPKKTNTAQGRALARILNDPSQDQMVTESKLAPWRRLEAENLVHIRGEQIVGKTIWIVKLTDEGERRARAFLRAKR